RRAGGRVDLVAMVGLDDLDVDAVAQHACGHLQQLEAEVHAHAHVGREHDGNFARRDFYLRARAGVEAGGADHHAPAGPAAGVDMRRYCGRGGEIDEHVAVGEHGGNIIAYGDVQPAHAGELA